MPGTSVQKQVFTVDDFLTWQRNGTLELSPSFQRRSVWRPTDRSYFLDTVVRGMPTSAIYIRQKREFGSVAAKREVVDGQQRLRTLIAFITPGNLSDFAPERDSSSIQKKHNDNPEIFNKGFDDLSIDVQRAIMDYDFSTHVLPASTDDAQILQIFARLNASGLKLTHQELRNAEFSGAFRFVSYELASEQLERWRKWRIFTEPQIARMYEVEMTSELLMLMTEGIIAKRQPAIRRYYEKNDDEYTIGEVSKQRFRAVMDAIEDYVPEVGKTVFRQQAMFYSLFGFLYEMMFGLGSNMEKVKHRAIESGTTEALLEASAIVSSGNIARELGSRGIELGGEGEEDPKTLVERVEKSLRGASGDAASRNVRLELLRRISATYA